MTPRERIHNALAFQPVDRIPLQVHPSPAGLHEHGRKLLDLMRACSHDFGDASGFTLPDPPVPGEFDPDGRYHAMRTDEWGTTWEHRLYGVWGHPIDWPLKDFSRLDEYDPPAPPDCRGTEFEQALGAAKRHQSAGYFLLGDGGSLFEKLHSLRPFEDVLVDIALDAPEIHRLEDAVAGHCAGCVRRALALGVDGVAFGDDFGTRSSLLMSLDDWRRFFKQRYDGLFSPVRRAGKPVFFHCCGKVDELLEEFAALGVAAIWPQLTVFDLPDLARRCRDLGLAVQLHPDRGELMQRGTPQDVREHVLRLIEIFDTPSGGSWLYIEIDPGFPFPNVEALFETAVELRA